MSNVKTLVWKNNETLSDDDIIYRAEAGETIDSIVNLIIKKEGTKRHETKNRVELILYQYGNSKKQNKKSASYE